MAEEGDFSGISSKFSGFGTDGAVFGHAGFPGAPVFDPGELTAAIFDIGPNDRYFSFASMVIPSNDAFIGNGDPLAYELFDVNGIFNGPLTIDIVGSDIYDAGTEVNDGLGAPFSTNGGMSTDEDGVVGPHPGLGNFLGTDTVAGTTIGSIPGPNTPFARITITQVVPEPAISGMLVCLVGLATRRRRRKLNLTI